MPVFRSEYPNTEIVVDLQEIEKINVPDANNCRNFATKEKHERNLRNSYEPKEEIVKTNGRFIRIIQQLTYLT